MCCFHPCGILTAAIFTIIQCLPHMILCISMILVYTCQVTIYDINNLLNLFYLTYFYRKTCTADSLSSLIGINIDIDNINSENDVNITILEVPNEVPFAEYTLYFASVYSLADLVWIITAIVLLCSYSKRNNNFYYFPWVVWTLVNCIFDGIVTSIYAKQIFETITLKGWLSFLGTKSNFSIPNDTYVDNELFLSVPSITLTLIFSRFLIVWFANVIFLLSLSILMCKSCSAIKEENYENVTSTSYHPENILENSVDHEFLYLKPTDKEERKLGDVEEKPKQNLNPYSNELRIKKWQLYYGQEATDLRIKGSRLSTSSNPVKNDEKNNGRSYNQTGYFQQNVKPPIVNNSAGGEMRGQFPWSYFQNDENTKVKRPASPDEIMPPVPVPDYQIGITNKNRTKDNTN